MIGFADSEVTVSEPTSFNISVILLDNNLEPGTAVQLDIRAMDGVATGMGSCRHMIAVWFRAGQYFNLLLLLCTVIHKINDTFVLNINSFNHSIILLLYVCMCVLPACTKILTVEGVTY